MSAGAPPCAPCAPCACLQTYVVTVMRGYGPDAEAWDIDKRYSQFDELNQQLKVRCRHWPPAGLCPLGTLLLL